MSGHTEVGLTTPGDGLDREMDAKSLYGLGGMLGTGCSVLSQADKVSALWDFTV